MTDSLRADTINALSWSFLESVVARGIQFVIGIILARLLFPAQFGLIGMLWIFVAVAQTLVDSGFGAALIQKAEATHTDICSIFYFNILLSLLIAGLLCLIAPWIADFYRQPVLTALVRVFSLVIVVNSLGSIQGNLLLKEMNLKAHTIASLVSGLVSGIVGIYMAFKGFGVWSLAAQQISGAVLQAACLWGLSPWRPALIFSPRSLKEMFGYGSRMLFSGLLETVFQNIYSVVIGRLFAAADLGLFARAKNLQSQPSQTLSNVVTRVTFPAFSMSQDDPARVKRGLRKALTAIALLNFPIMIGLAATARPLVIVLLGQKWAGCIHYLQLLCIVGFFYPLHATNLNILMAMGRSDLFMRLEVIKKALAVVNLLIAWRWGVLGIIYGMVAIEFIAFYLNTMYNQTLIGYSLWEQLKDLAPFLAVALLMGAGVLALGLLRFHGYALMLPLEIITAMVVYFGVCWGFKLRAFVEVRREVFDRIRLFRAGAAA